MPKKKKRDMTKKEYDKNPVAVKQLLEWLEAGGIKVKRTPITKKEYEKRT